MHITSPRRVKAVDRADAIPRGFDPIRYPIIATHFLGINPRAQTIDGACLLSTKEAA